MKILAALCAALILSACGKAKAPTPTYFETENPKLLSAWGQIGITNGQLHLGEDVTPYDLNSPLFSDYASKLRTIWVSGNKAGTYNDKDVFDFPTGTVITKTFYYVKGKNAKTISVKPHSLQGTRALGLDNIKLIETRILVRRAEKWTALPYVWNEDQTDAVLSRTGDLKRLTLTKADGSAHDFAYIVPNVNQCAGCHAVNSQTKDILPIGPKARHLNRDYDYETRAENQLSHWQIAGLIEDAPENAPRLTVWDDANASIEARARAYLDINCSHCHSETGPADTSGLHLTPDTPTGPHLGLCKTPIAAGTGTGNRKFGIVPSQPDASIFVYRMDSTNPAVMMPEVGRALVHTEGVTLIRNWISEMAPSACGT